MTAHPHVEQERRRWVFRSAVLLGVTAIILSFFVTWRRDETTVHAMQRSLKPALKHIQARLAQTGLLPGDLPPEMTARVELHLTGADRFYASQTSEPVIIAAGPLVALHLKEDGRAVIIYHQNKVHSQWMSGREYEAAMAAQTAAMAEFERQRRAKPLNLP